MSDTGSRMEVCPYCKKPFKRLKSHLPHCKVMGPDTAVGQVYHSKPAIPPRTKKEKRPIKDLTKAKRRERETENKSRDNKLISDRPEWTVGTVGSFPPPVGLERVGARKADKEIKDPDRRSFPQPEKTSQGEMAALPRASVTTSPKTEFVKDVPKSEESRRGLSETGTALLAGTVEPPFKEARKYSRLPGDVRASSPNRTLDPVDLQRQGLLAKLQDVPVSDSHPPENLSSVQRERAPASGKENGSRGGGHLPGASTGPSHTETLGKIPKPLTVGLHTNLLSELQVRENPEKEDGLRVKCGSKENAQKSVSVTGMQDWASVDSDYRNFTKEKPPDGILLNLSMSQEATHRKLLSTSQPSHQSLSSLAVKSLQFCGPHPVSALTLSGESKEQASLEARSACHPQALQMACQPSSYSAQHLFSKMSPASLVAAGDAKALPISMGLEWFPELYPGYVGLGVLPRTPQHWNSTAQMPQLASPRGESLSQGWVRCSTTVRRSGVGAVTMLFAGYFVLGCRWSFRHLKLQRWRK
uniref:uncharacterized protein C17orf80 homolog isoform X2 n=1 Tax=Jaculus jaculus TaxID=51337 RepID=UPI001E1B563F|nr:uncharacterized protein C17orf80 homolog isoform X2 [Jaculus jaculus]